MSAHQPMGRRRPAGSVRADTAASAAVAALAAAGIVVALIGGSVHRAPYAKPRLAVDGGVALVDARANRVAGRMALPERPLDIVFRGGSAWALLPRAQQVARVELATGRVQRTIRLPFRPGGMAREGDAVFVTQQGGPGVARISATRDSVTARWEVATRGARVSEPTGIAAGAGSVWLARDTEVVRVDGSTGRTQHRFALPVAATLLTFADGRLWAAGSENGLVVKIDPETDEIAAQARLRGRISALAVTGPSAWAAVVPDGVVFRLDANDASVQETVRVGRDPQSLAADERTLWAADASGRALIGIDMRSGARSTITLTGTPELVRSDVGRLWVGA
jgi:antitoxin (DNA-binding transcriptional repressor) of toxin-antitoxin stability system